MLPDLPALKEILPEGQAVYFPRGSVEGMLETLEWTYQHPTRPTNAPRPPTGASPATYTNRARSIHQLYWVNKRLKQGKCKAV